MFFFVIGDHWIGDYGSSVRYENHTEYLGGNPFYQIDDLDYSKKSNLKMIDLVGLIISFLVSLDVYSPKPNQKFENMSAAINKLNNNPEKRLFNLFCSWRDEVNKIIICVNNESTKETK